MSKRESWLRNTMAELMGIDASEVSLTESFAEQGVDSLVGLRLTRKLQEELDVEVELEWLFDNPNIRDLSKFLDERFGAWCAKSFEPH